MNWINRISTDVNFFPKKLSIRCWNSGKKGVVLHPQSGTIAEVQRKVLEQVQRRKGGQKKVWFLFGGTENKAFLCSRFRKRGTQVQRGISARAATAAGTGPRVPTSRSDSGAVRVAVFFEGLPWKKKAEKKLQKIWIAEIKSFIFAAALKGAKARGSASSLRKFRKRNSKRQKKILESNF